jgi:hypothetical protein
MDSWLRRIHELDGSEHQMTSPWSGMAQLVREISLQMLSDLTHTRSYLQDGLKNRLGQASIAHQFEGRGAGVATAARATAVGMQVGAHFFAFTIIHFLFHFLNCCSAIYESRHISLVPRMLRRH